MKQSFITIGIISMILCAVASSVDAAGLQYGGWIPYWRAIPGIVDVNNNINNLDSISPFNFEITADGKLIDKGAIDTETWKTLYAKAKKKSIEIYPTILWTNAAQMHVTLSDPKLRKKHIADIDTTILKNKNYAGVDIDYEGKFADTKDGFSTFLTELSAKTKARKKTLICTIESRTPVEDRFETINQGVLDSIQYSNDLAVIGRVCDQVRVMTYDQGAVDITLNAVNKSKDYYAPVADPAWVEKVIKLMTVDIPAQKLHLGLASYGYVYEVTAEPTSGFNYKRMRAINYPAAVALAQQYGQTPVRNVAGELSFTYTKPDAPGKTYLAWYSDSVAMQQKIDLAKKYNLGGVSVFKFDGEHDADMWKVIDTRK